MSPSFNGEDGAGGGDVEIVMREIGEPYVAERSDGVQRQATRDRDRPATVIRAAWWAWRPTWSAGGAHFCLGAHLARLETRTLLDEVLTRLPDLALDGPVVWLPSHFINGLKSMPVRFTPAYRHCA